MTLPNDYAWLADEPAPRVLREALALHGVRETPGPGDNPVILGWARELGVEKTYTADSIPWCALFAAVVVKRAGYKPVVGPLWALNWQTWGNPADVPMLGDLLVFRRRTPTGWAGHIGIYVGEGVDEQGRPVFHVLGGNQDDEVNIRPILKSRLVAARRSPWRVAQPPNVRRIHLAATGAPMAREA